MTPPAGALSVRQGFLLSDPPVGSLADYVALGGTSGLARAQALGPDGTIAEISASGLQGRGGAGFPTGRKWAAVAMAPGAHYVVCNGAEGEPGTFKDRALMRNNPYQALEGLAIAAYAVGARAAYIAVKARFGREVDALYDAMVAMSEADVLGDVPITLVTGPDEYLFGEEKALLEVVEGEAPLPRNLPPYLHGLHAVAPQLGWSAKDGNDDDDSRAESNPTVVNNVETLSTVAHILARGTEWFRGFGTSSSPGTVVTTVVGDVTHPGVFEVELGTPLADVIGMAGGVSAGHAVKAVLSGAANGILTGDDLDLALDRETLAAAGSGLGAAGFIVYDDTACMVEVARLFSRFLWIESCGQCLCCKLGTGEITAGLTRLERGDPQPSEMDSIARWLHRVTDSNRCYLPVQEQRLVGSIIARFPHEFADHLAGRCARPRTLPLPKLVDLADGVATYDRRHELKQPDWTYTDG
jgi:NADH-quinone oxidoreductase subunit F